jgi:hypothetical protein
VSGTLRESLVNEVWLSGQKTTTNNGDGMQTVTTSYDNKVNQ